MAGLASGGTDDTCQVGHVNVVGIDRHEMADSQPGEVLDNQRPAAADTNDADLLATENLLAPVAEYPHPGGRSPRQPKPSSAEMGIASESAVRRLAPNRAARYPRLWLCERRPALPRSGDVRCSQARWSARSAQSLMAGRFEQPVQGPARDPDPLQSLKVMTLTADSA